MMFDLPDDATLYAALLARDPAYDGRAWVAVRSTGIFCRLTCPAPKPKQVNCTFHDSAQACLEAGYRPCKRCHPVGEDPLVARLMDALEADPTRRWREDDLTAMGLDPSTVRRAFRRATGQTFLELARTRRLAAGIGALAAGDGATEAQLDAGFDSPSAFRAAFARIMGRSPGQFTRDAVLWADWITTPLGPMVAVADQHALHLLEFLDRKALPKELDRLWKMSGGRIGFGRPAPTQQVAEELSRYHGGTDPNFAARLAPQGTPFQQAVWAELRRIPAGQTRSYSELARALGRPSATRAVAAANGANPIAILIPCHRILGADGSLTGYGGGLWRKRRLIEIERQYVSEGETP